jgi:hypothetical protein
VLRVLRLAKLMRVVKIGRLMKKYMAGDPMNVSPTLEAFYGFLRSFKLVMALLFLG